MLTRGREVAIAGKKSIRKEKMTTRKEKITTKNQKHHNNMKASLGST